MASVVDINGELYTVGLFWYNIEPSVSHIESARKKAEKLRNGSLRIDTVLTRYGRRQYKLFQYGIVDSRSVLSQIKKKATGEKKNFFSSSQQLPPSLALSIVDQFEVRSWLGFFPLAEGYWICAMGGGQLLLQGDSFYTDKEKAREAFENLRDKDIPDSGWLEICDFKNIQESMDYLQKNINPYSHKYAPLYKKKSGTGNILKYIAILGAIAGGAYYMGYLDSFFPEDIPIAPPASEIFPSVWKKEPLPQEVYNLCVNTMKKVNFSENGWNFVEATCEKGKLKVQYKRSEYGSYKNVPKDAKFTDKNENIVFVDIPIKGKVSARSAKQGNEKLLSLLDLKKHFLEENRKLMNGAKLVFNIDSVKVEQKLWPDGAIIGETPGAEMIKAPFLRAPVTFTVNTFPEAYVRVLNSLPGTVLKRVVFKKANASIVHIITGEVYANVK